MALAVSTSTLGFHRSAQAYQAALRGEAEALQRQVATGERLERASDDPVAAARLRALARADRIAGVEAGNALRAREELGAASDRMDQMASTLVRARELAVLAANGATSAEGRAAIATEVAALRETMLSLANSTSANGEPLFAGQGSGPAYVEAADGTVTYVGTTDAGELEVGPGIAVQRGLAGPAILSFDHAGGPSDAFAVLGALEQGLRGGAGDPAMAARDSLVGLDAAIETLGRGQAVVGTRLAWVDTVETIASQMGESRAVEAADAGGADLAATISRLQQVMTALEASQASYARLASLSLFDRI
ncbi:MAG: flagellar biosynthesis protein FlgL [Sphingomonadaceae bacterium]|nr:flagellar biosynthesis protein FlgL [Sphingomonadaceae bacterium]